MPSKASPFAAAAWNPEMENSLEPSSLTVRKDMNAGAAPDFAGNCHCVAGGLSGAHVRHKIQSEILHHGEHVKSEYISDALAVQTCCRRRHMPAQNGPMNTNLISLSEPVICTWFRP